MELKLPPPKKESHSCDFVGPDLDNLNYVAEAYGFTNRKGRVLRNCVNIAAQFLRGELPPSTIKSQAERGVIKFDTTTKPPLDWDKGDELPDLAPPTPTASADPKLQALIDIFNEPLPYQRPKKLTTPIRSQDEPAQTTAPNIIPANRKMIIRMYWRDNYLQDHGTPRSREVSASTMKLLLEGHSIKPGSDIWDLIERDMEKMQSYPDHIQKWFVHNPRWPQADPLIYGEDYTPSKYEI